MEFNSVKEIIDIATDEGLRISDIVLRKTALDMDKSETEIYEMMLENYNVMKIAVKDGLKDGTKSSSGLVGSQAYKYLSHSMSGDTLAGSLLAKILCNTIAVSEINACMGIIVATPTAGSCGIMPGILTAIQEHYMVADEDIIHGMLNAAGIGMVIAKNASISGAEGGCQAECGSAGAMVASAIVQIMGGTPEMCGHAAAQVLKSLLGLVCDPVAGLVEEPCVIRNASTAAIALSCADLTLSDITSIIPVDEVIIAMGEIGQMLPKELKETSLGGLATTPTGIRLTQELIK